MASKSVARSSPLPFVSEDTAGLLQKIWSQLQPNEAKLASGMVLGEQSKYLRWEFPHLKTPTLELLQITDVQFGHVCCKYERVIEYRDWVLSAPNRYMLWTGDNVDAWAMWSPGRAFEQLGDPQSQIFKFVEIWAPARHRILGYVGGNHERRAIPGFGDLGVLLAVLLKIPYSSGRQMLDIYFGRHRPFKVTLWHGVGGAQTKGAIAQKLDRYMSIGDSQAYLMGHLHQAMIVPAWKEVRDEARQRIATRKVIGCIGTSFMDHWGSYGEVKGYHASDVMMPLFQLDREGGWECRLR